MYHEDEDVRCKYTQASQEYQDLTRTIIEHRLVFNTELQSIIEAFYGECKDTNKIRNKFWMNCEYHPANNHTSFTGFFHFFCDSYGPDGSLSP